MSVKTNPSKTNALKPLQKPRQQMVAWLIITISFCLFCSIIFGVINLLGDYLSRSTEFPDAELQVKNGPVYIVRAEQNIISLAKTQDKVKPGDTILVEEQGIAQLVLFDGTRLEIKASTKVFLQESMVLIENFVRKEKKLKLEISPGGEEKNGATVGQVTLWSSDINSSNYTGNPVEVTTSDKAHIAIDSSGQNSFKIEVERTTDNSSRTFVTSLSTNRNQLNVDAAGITQIIGPGQRVIVNYGQAPTLISGSIDELIRNNGSFINGLDAWVSQKLDNGNLDNISCDLFSDSERIDDGTISRMHIRRSKDTKDSFECSIHQDLNADVTRYQSLNFKFKLKILNQSLTGGGFEGFEFPLFIKINYTDSKGVALTYFKGFYIVPPDPQKGTRVVRNSELTGTEQVKQGEWIEYISDDMMLLRPKPYKITSIQIGSAGHDYEAVFTDLSLEARG